LRASLVKGETLAELAQEFKLGDYLKLGAGELRSGGFRNKSILADAMEAVVAAIYLDAGMQVCQQCILNWYGSRLQTSDEMTAEKDPKTRLQEFLQARKLDLPVYAVLSMEGEAHNQIFRVSCRVNNLPYITEGSAHSRRHAEQEAAQKYLDIIEHV
jgi:ribonuclease III